MAPPDPPGRDTVRVGRRLFLGLVALGAAGVAVGAKVQNAVGRRLGQGLGSLLPGGDHFRIYSVSGTLPLIRPDAYRLHVGGLVTRPTTYTLDDLKALPSTHVVRAFQCVTGWRVPDVPWRGVRLSDLLDHAGVAAGGSALTFESYDGTDTESLTLDQARLPDVLVAYEMYGAPVTREHGGPVRLLVPQMYGYKSLKWLSAVTVVDQVIPGFWEHEGYPVNGWLDGSTGPTNPDPRLS